MNSTIQIAEVLNVSPNQIKSVREMAWVYCVVVVGQRATFVSKKKVEAVTVQKEEIKKPFSSLSAEEKAAHWAAAAEVARTQYFGRAPLTPIPSNNMVTSTGDVVDADEWDEIEGNM